MVEWRIWYDDGTSYSDADGPVWDAPARGVQVVVQAEAEVGRRLWAHRDFYWWRDDRQEWTGGDIFGLWDYLTETGPRKVLFGRSVANATYQACVQRALDDPELPAKTARHQGEVF